jgi:hypothetical protein
MGGTYDPSYSSYDPGKDLSRPPPPPLAPLF